MIDYKKLVESLSDENITKRAYDAAVSKIDAKVDDIWRYICQVSNRKLSWWAFRNDVELGSGDGSTGGNFDPQDDAEFIEIIGENQNHRSRFYEYNNGFPTSFLWEDYESIVKSHLEHCLNEDLKAKKTEDGKKRRKKAESKARQATVSVLKSKLEQMLTKEELDLILFLD